MALPAVPRRVGTTRRPTPLVTRWVAALVAALVALTALGACSPQQGGTARGSAGAPSVSARPDSVGEALPAASPGPAGAGEARGPRVPTEVAADVPPAPAPDAVPEGSGKGQRVVYSIERQRVWLVQAGGEVERTYRVSGQLSQPGPGTYAVYSKSRHTTSAVSRARMQYMVRFARGKRTGAPIGFHDIPQEFKGRFEQTEAQLGQPLSAGCIRQARKDAVHLWEFAPVGTKVVVTA